MTCHHISDPCLIDQRSVLQAESFHHESSQSVKTHFTQSIPSNDALAMQSQTHLYAADNQWSRLRNDDEIPVNHQLQTFLFSPQNSFLKVAARSDDDFHLFEQIFYLSA